MKTGRYLTIQRAFMDYGKNKKALENYPYPYTGGVDYTKPRVKGDNTKNGAEQMVLSVIEKKLDLERFIELVDKTIDWFKLEGYGRERYIQKKLIRGETAISACMEIGIDERTGRRWKRDIFEKAEIIAEDLGIFSVEK